MATTAESAQDTHRVNLKPVGGGESWTAELTTDFVTLKAPAGKTVLTVVREDVARHMRFAWDLRHGRTISFVIVEGMKDYTFTTDPGSHRELVSWLPRKSVEEERHEVRLHAIAMAAAGVVFLLRPEDFHPIWGILFIVFGATATALGVRMAYAYNGVLMFLFGIAQILPANLSPIEEGNGIQTAHVFPTIAAAVLLCWGVQQFSMLSINAQIRKVRSERDLPGAYQSPLVRRVAWLCLVAGGVLWLYAALLLYFRATASRVSIADMAAALRAASPEIVVFATLAAFATGAGILLLYQKRPAYLDAKVAAQVVLVGFMFVLWSIILNVDPNEPLAIFGPIFANSDPIIMKPYVWLSLLPIVLLFNRWYARNVDRELEEATS